MLTYWKKQQPGVVGDEYAFTYICIYAVAATYRAEVFRKLLRVAC